jgi:hypothetical protein
MGCCYWCHLYFASDINRSSGFCLLFGCCYGYCYRFGATGWTGCVKYDKSWNSTWSDHFFVLYNINYWINTIKINNPITILYTVWLIIFFRWLKNYFTRVYNFIIISFELSLYLDKLKHKSLKVIIRFSKNFFDTLIKLVCWSKSSLLQSITNCTYCADDANTLVNLITMSLFFKKNVYLLSANPDNILWIAFTAVLQQLVDNISELTGRE